VKTLRLSVDPGRLDTVEAREAMGRAAAILRSGGLVALPTETVYGLGANALDPAAVARIFAAKERPSWDPIIVHIAGPTAANPMLDKLATGIPAPAQRLIEAFWPGPLTLLLPRSALVPDLVTAGRPLVGLRMPSHPVAYEVIRLAGIPVAAPSANTFSRISPTTAAHVLEDLDGRIDAILDAGPTHHGLESTVLDPCPSPMVIYRPGAISADDIRSVAGPVEIYRSGAPSAAAPLEALPSPGVGLRHYAPRARLILIAAPFAELPARLAEAAASRVRERIGLMLPAELLPHAPPAAAVFPWGRWSVPEEMGRALYAGLRALDSQGCTVILCPVPSGDGISAAIRDRLNKAAAKE
jgi:L-threonylcarbamoyladenylate synthase